MIDLKAETKKYIKLERVKDFLTDEVNRMYIILGATLVVAALYVTFLIFPKVSLLRKTSREVNELNEKMSLVMSRVKKLDLTTKKLKKQREEERAYSRQLPAEKEIPDFLEDLAGTAEKSGLKILSVTPHALAGNVPGRKKGKKKEKTYYRAMPIVVTAKSGYHELGEFVNRLETGERFIKVEDLSIDYDPATPRRHDIKLVLETYVSVEE